jgi:hypothetical protein
MGALWLREEIAACCAASYQHLAVPHFMKLLFASNPSEIADVLAKVGSEGGGLWCACFCTKK